MEQIKIKANAKLNLGLDIIKKRNDGYHDIKTLMHSVEIFDVLEFKTSEKIVIDSDTDLLQNDKTNIVYKCIEAIQKQCGCKYGLESFIQKNIPKQAGLGGGSADGAAALYAYNILYGLNYEINTLAAIGATVGADIPFLLYGGCALCEGIGDVITKYDTIFTTPCVIVMPNMQVNTKAAYEYMDNTPTEIRCDFESIMRKIRYQEFANTSRCINNIFEKYMASIQSDSLNVKKELLNKGAFASGLTGSGACFYGLFKDEKTAKKAAETLSEKYLFSFATRLCGNSLSIL